MQSTEDIVARHYQSDGIYDRIWSALAAEGIDKTSLTMDHLKGVDEFHIGGRTATRHLLDPLDIGAHHNVLDVGCGIGGPARFIAKAYGAKVVGIDLTYDYVDTAKCLTADLGMDVIFVQGSATALPFEANQFDLVTLLHVGMNVADKELLFRQVARVLKSSGVFAIYDIMQHKAHPKMPLPWAGTLDGSFVDTPDVYRQAGKDAGFVLVREEGRGSAALASFAAQKKAAQEGRAPTIGLSLLLGSGVAEKFANLVTALHSGDVEPIEMIFRSSLQ